MRILAGATTALRRIVDLGLVILILIVLFGVILGKVTPLLGRQSIVIGGGSMEPAIGLGSAIVVRPVDPAALAVGDVVSMQVGPERTTFTHRIVAVVDKADGRWVRTQGDANAAPDPTIVPASAIIGRVEFVIPFAGYLLALLSLPMGVMFVLGLAATLLAVAWLLESLELEPRPARRTALPDSTGRSGSTARPESTGDAIEPASGLPDWLNGEPIAARPAPDDRSGRDGTRPAGLRGGAGSSVPNRRSASGLPAAGATFAAHARPSVREQLARSREARNRRTRWLLGRERNPLTD